MLNLILKDVYLLKKQALLALLYIPVMFIAFSGGSVGAFATGVVGFTYMMVMTACAYEEKNKADIMMNSLPLKRSSIVLAKYLSLLLYVLIGTVVYLVFIVLYSFFDGTVLENAMTIQGVIGALAGVTFITGIYLPVFFKMGYIKSKMYNFVLFFAFFIGISTLVNSKFYQNMSISKDLEKFLDSLGEVGVAVMLLLGMFAFMAVSYSLAVRFYKAREF